MLRVYCDNLERERERKRERGLNISSSRSIWSLLTLFVDRPLPAVVRLDDGRDGGADHQDAGQAAVGDPVVRHPVEPLSEHRAENTEDL